jgi:hypothetical protein
MLVASVAMPSDGGLKVAAAASATSVKEEWSVRSEESGALWEGLVSVREEFDRSEVSIPELRSRIDGRPRDPDAKTVQFAEALAFSASWSRISEARNRRLAA